MQPQTWSPQAVIEDALEEVQRRKSGWTQADLVAAVNAALPDYLGIPDGADVARLLDQLAAEAVKYANGLDAVRPGDDHLPAELRLRNGESAYQEPGARLYATPDHVCTERALLAATAAGGARAVHREVAQRFLRGLAESGLELGVDQAAAVRGVLTSGNRIECLVGPAGTGKSFVVGALAKAWTDPTLAGPGLPPRAFGLATSQIATEVLAAEGLQARNIAGWLATQDRLAAGPAAPGPRPVEGDQGWRLRAGDLVVVDESAMTDTPALAAIHRHVDGAGAKLLLVGDHKQLAAVGAGGGMDLLAQAGARYELAEARRFDHDWEGSASLRLRVGDASVLREYHQHGRLIDAGTVDQAEGSAAGAWLADTLAGHRSLLLVDTNAQADRLCARLRADLVRLGRVQEGGVALGLQGTFAGVGDLVQARRNGWDLAGYQGNRRGPVNRETYRVLAVRDDGGLEVASLTGRGAVGQQLGERIVLPARYVSEHLALGYAATGHARRAPPWTPPTPSSRRGPGPAALYVGMSRGRDTNTAHVVTLTGADDPARGREDDTLHRDPRAVLAGVLDTSDQAGTRSALATATEAAAQADNVRTPAELLADAAQLAGTERTATWLDQLTDARVLSGPERARIAAEDGAASLTRILRRAELAGHDPRGVLHNVIAHRSFDGARNLTNVIYSRIREEHESTLDPVGETWAAWSPAIDNAEWSDYLAALATAADGRARVLGQQAAIEQPAWAVESLGPPPAQLGQQRDDWERHAGTVAACRELLGHDDPADALGPAPKPGQVEHFAAYRAAWRALGRPEIEREELELSDGQLRMRIRAYQRETPWAPRYVGNELAGTRQAADAYRRTAGLRTAEADTATDDVERAGLQRAAADAATLADTLDRRAGELQALDDARARWLAHTAGTRAAAERSKAELAARYTDDAEPEQRVTAQEWLAAQRACDRIEDAHRAITDETDLTDLAAARERDVTTAAESTDRKHDVETATGTAADDIRAVAAREPAQVNEDVVRVPDADETSAALAHAQRALAEINARQAGDEREAAEHRNAQLARWYAADRVADEQSTDDVAERV
jgi:hypothetical protein